MKKLFNYEINLPTRQVFLIRYGECMTAPLTSAIINCPFYIKTHKFWEFCELSIYIFCHVITCHEKDLGFKIQIYEEIQSTSHILAVFCYPRPPRLFLRPYFVQSQEIQQLSVLSHEKTVTTKTIIVMISEKCFVQPKDSNNRR